MAERRLGIIALLLCACLCVMPYTAWAASTTDAREPVAVDRECTLTIAYSHDGTAFPDQRVQLYHIADVSADFQYTLTAAFAETGLILNGIQTNGEWKVIRTTLESYIVATKVAPSQTTATDESGKAAFSKLTPGLYLVSAVRVTRENTEYFFDSALIAVPGLGEDGLWQYDVAVSAKSEILPPTEPDEEIQLKVLKLWKGDEGRPSRPKSIEVEIFRDGTSYGIVKLSEENNWSYSWSAKADGATWTVVERNVPDGYTMTVGERETTFIITNTYQDLPKPPPPQTGDTANTLLYTILMYVSGTMLILLGVARKRRRHDETKETTHR